MSQVSDVAWGIVRDALELSERARSTSCLHFAAAAHAVVRGTGWRLVAGGAFLGSSEVVGWGCSVSPRDRTYSVHADLTVSIDDGSYCGHCWLECGDRHFRRVLDVMEGYRGPAQVPEKLIVYHRVPSLWPSIRSYHAERLRRVQKAARAHPTFRALVLAEAHQAVQL